MFLWDSIDMHIIYSIEKLNAAFLTKSHAHCTLHIFAPFHRIFHFFRFFFSLSFHPFHTCQTETDFNSNVQNGIVLNFMNTDMCCWNAFPFTNERPKEKKLSKECKCMHFTEHIHDKNNIAFDIFSFFIGPSSFAEWWCFLFLWSEYYEKYNRQRHKEKRERERKYMRSNKIECKRTHNENAKRDEKYSRRTLSTLTHELIEMNIHTCIRDMEHMFTVHICNWMKRCLEFFLLLFWLARRSFHGSWFKAYHNKHP